MASSARFVERRVMPRVLQLFKKTPAPVVAKKPLALVESTADDEAEPIVETKRIGSPYRIIAKDAANDVKAEMEYLRNALGEKIEKIKLSPDNKIYIILTPETTDSDLEHFRRVNNVEGLFLSGAKEVGDEGMKCLTGLSSLKALDLRGTEVGDEGIKYLSGTSIEWLNLINTRVTNNGAPYLTQLTSLRFLSYSRERINEGLGPVRSKIPHLQLMFRGETLISKAKIGSFVGYYRWPFLFRNG